MAPIRAILIAALLSIPAWGADLPQGALPVLDGKIGAEEWKGAYKMPVPHGTAYLRTSGRVLCVAVAVDRPYAGERIDLRTSDPAGDRLTLIQIHPACYLPRPPFSALPPVMIRRSTWKERSEAKYTAPYSARARSQVMQKDAKTWSTEFCIAFEALDLPIQSPAVFLLTISRPFSGENRPLTTPPNRWEPLKATWDPKADLYMTAKEDEIHAWAQTLFNEGLDRARNRDPETPVLGAALDNRMDETKIAEQIRLADLEVELAPNQYHALWYRLHILRRANRLKQADEAYRMLVERLPVAERLNPVRQERNAALLAECRFDDFERENRGVGKKLMNWVQEMRTAWDLEANLRKRSDGARVLIRTARGEIEVQLYRSLEEGYDDLLVQWLREAKLTEKAPKWATGAQGVAWTGMPSKARVPKVDHPPRAWRGTVALLPDRSLAFATGPLHLTRPGTAIGHVVKGMEHVDAMTASDRILELKVTAGTARNGGD